MTLTENKTLQIGIVGSVAVHVLLFLLLAWLWGADAAARWLAAQTRAEAEKQVTLLFPDQIMEVKPEPLPPPAPPPPPPPKAAPKPYIRTTQNKASDAAPAKADFVSDRNTIAASQKAAAPDGTKPMPTQDGTDRTTLELANRNQRDGETKNDSAAQPSPMLPNAPRPEMRVPEPSVPQPTTVAKATNVSPMAKMLEEVDKDMARSDGSRLPLEVKKPDGADAPPKADADTPAIAKPKPAEESPPVAKAQPADASNPPKAVPIDPKTGKPVPKFNKDEFSPFTRTSKVKGTINNRGEDAVNAAETPMGTYMRIVTASVEKKWHLYRKKYGDAVTFGNLKLRFFVTKEGKPEDFEVLSKPDEADVRMADFTLRAIKDAEIPPIPADLLPILEGERVEIEYDVLIY